MSFTKKPKTINPDEVDPSVYYYDEVYDDMKNEEQISKKELTDTKTINRDSKYIKGLIETAELRKTEKELRKFKKYSRDREEAIADGNGGEEVYLTSSYKRKLKEMKSLEDERRHQLELEKDNSMNFLKQTSNRSEELPNRTDEPEKKDVSRTSRTSTEVDDASTSREISSDIHNEPKCKKTPLRTFNDRRRFLEEILAKRTVGRRYEEAIQRYIRRKDLVQ